MSKNSDLKPKRQKIKTEEFCQEIPIRFIGHKESFLSNSFGLEKSIKDFPSKEEKKEKDFSVAFMKDKHKIKFWSPYHVFLII